MRRAVVVKRVMPSVAPETQLPSAHAQLAMLRDHLEAGRLVLLLDFDGTLTPIVSRPELAVLPERSREVLVEASRRCLVAVISGRGVGDVAERVAIPTIVYAGCHGLVLRGPGIDEVQPLARLAEEQLRAARAQLQAELGDVEGVLIEEKDYSCAVHFRLAPEREAQVVDVVTRVAQPHDRLVVRRGKMLAELVPTGGHKGLAVRAIIAKLAPAERFVVYVGDDVTDEDGFEAVGSDGLGIVVGALTRRTLARARLEDCDDVLRFLERLTE